uniref:Protein kinase domain-containing protein n=1 Tax=Haptolina brevifila TaxID=156173 RepID=A0A7S2JAU0_9EUKA
MTKLDTPKLAIPSSKGSAGRKVPGLGLGLSLGVGKLDLSRIAPRTVEGDRPDDEGRRPPTPPSVVVERLKAAALARAAEGGDGQGGSEASGAGAQRRGLTQSVSLPDVNLTQALQELSISELSAALSHHSSNRSLPNAAWAIDSSEIKFGRRLGAGAYGEVYEAEWRRSRVAVKRLLTVSPLEETAVRQFFEEMDILSNARHDHIVRFLGGCVQPDNLCILFEFCPQSLYDLLRKTEEPLELQRVLTIARQVALGIYYLHCCKPPVLHLDLKSANVLIDAHGYAKVCDFGLAKLKPGTDVRTERMGSPMWTAPEVLKGAARDEKADTYSFGMLLYELLTRHLPYVGFAATQVVMGVITNLLPRPELGPDASHYPKALVELMKQCWAFEASERPAFSAILDAIERVAQEAGIPFDGNLSS